MAEIKAAGVAGDGARVFGLYAKMLEKSLADLASAGMAYPYEYRFRVAQAKALAAAAERFLDLSLPAIQALTYARAVDPLELELIGMMILMQRQAGQCEAARISGQRYLALAPRSVVGHKLVASLETCSAS